MWKVPKGDNEKKISSLPCPQATWFPNPRSATVKFFYPSRSVLSMDKLVWVFYTHTHTQPYSFGMAALWYVGVLNMLLAT